MNSTKTSKAIYIIGLLFFIFGFVTWLNSTLILYLRLICELKTDVQAFFVTFVFYMSYFLLSIPAAAVLKKTGFKKGMAYGLAVLGVGALLFVPAASSRSFPMFLTALFIQGSGLSLLQTASNPYISILGPIESAAKRISIMGICNKGAGALAPLIMGVVLLNGTDSIRKQLETIQDPAAKANLLNELAGRIMPPYIIIGIVFFIVAFFILRSGLPEIELESGAENSTPEAARKNIFAYPHLLLGVLCIFCCVGVEVIAGDGIAVYGKSLGMPLEVVKNFPSYTLLAMLAGYVVGIVCIPKRFSQQMGLRGSAILGLVFSTIALFTTGYTAILFIALLGLANALMWPAVWPLAIDGLGKHIKTGAAMLVMGICGGAVVIQTYGQLKLYPAIGNQLAFYICTVPCYGYILFYAIRGHKVGR
jgi:FHS family L-fucose permease-like MFS transporter